MKKRLDVVMVDRGLVESRQRAQALVLAGAVTVDGSRVARSAAPIEETAEIEIQAVGEEYVSRGGLKLAAALDSFALDVAGRIAVDVGASTGGFTDVLLRRGAQRVYSIDVGYGQLDWWLRRDPRVVVMERTNFRHLKALPEAPRVAVVDVSFISLKLILPVLARLVMPDAVAIVLIKPQFEAGRGQVGKGGVVRDAVTHREVLSRVLETSCAIGWRPIGLIQSPLLGPAGNREFLAHLHLGCALPVDIACLVDEVAPGGARPPEGGEERPNTAPGRTTATVET